MATKNRHGLEFEVVQGWEQLPEGWSFTEVAGVACDSSDNVFVFCRGDHPVIVFDKEGQFINAWGENTFDTPHGIFIDGDDTVHLVDCGDHTVRQYRPNGELIRTLGEPGQSSDTGFEMDVSPVAYAGDPFNRLTNVAVLPDGGMYVADGYGNARVHKFDASGALEFSWGRPGSGPGEFNLPHGIAVDSAGTVYVADRENSRIQLFSPAGEYRASWDFVNRPDDIFIDDQDQVHVAELGFRSGVGHPPHYRLMNTPPPGHEPIARVGIYDPDGDTIARIGGDEEVLPGNFIAPHGLWADSRGDLYVGEVVVASGAAERLAPLEAVSFQKFKRSG
ncbi:MAG: peptidyl-alpha-hydroxyglycine alpha-amidating lyase family protein [Pseudomonadota bacterium]